MNSKLVFVTTYPPRECGIATFTQSLTNAITRQMDDTIEIEICALEDGQQHYNYPEEVKYRLDTSTKTSYIKTAIKINNDHQVRAVMIEHEFGLYSGHYGESLLLLLKELVKPVIVTFHSVLPEPDAERLQLVKEIADFSKKILVMTHSSKEILINRYDVSSQKIEVVPHGTYLVLWKRKEKAKEKFGFGNKLILSTFGFLGRNKSIETAIEALPEIKKTFPDVLYFVLGKTHPGLLKHEGELYRDFLEKKVAELNLEENVYFANRFIDLEELLDYLSVTDIYLFTSKDPHQAVSGTFAYAMSSACPIIATPIPHAKELLDNDSGIFIEFENSEQLARETVKLLKDKKLRERMGRNAFHKTRFTIWENVANETMDLFCPFIERVNFRYRIPPIKLQHIEYMTTKKGIIQFSDIDIADISSGYTLDDNTRALIALCWYFELYNKPSSLKLIQTYLDFIIFCQKSDGSFINYLDSDGLIDTKNNFENNEDALGRAIWALGYFLSKDFFESAMVEKAEKCLQKALKVMLDVHSPRSMAFIIKGLYFYNLKKNEPEITDHITIFANRLIDNFNTVADKNWNWFENYLTYANALLPEALLYSWKATGNISHHIIAKSTFDFMLSKTFKNDRLKVISNKGWFHKGIVNHEEFGEQPIDAAYTVMALDLFYSVIGDTQYLDQLKVAFGWFLGHNHLNQIVYNPATGGCYDGLEKNGVNLNQGAESTIAYLLARLTMENYNDVKKRMQNKPVMDKKRIRKPLSSKRKRFAQLQ